MDDDCKAGAGVGTKQAAADEVRKHRSRSHPSGPPAVPRGARARDRVLPGIPSLSRSEVAPTWPFCDVAFAWSCWGRGSCFASPN